MRTLVDAAMLVVLVTAAGCKAEPASGDETIESGSARTSPSGTAAALGAELAKEGPGSAAADAEPAGSGGSGSGRAAGGSGSAARGSGDGRAVAASVAPELAAIQLTLTSGWTRDVVAAGTIARQVEVSNRGAGATFVIQYGYDVPGAPTNREAYKVFLAQQNILRVTLDRQAGAAWYLEGTDAAGKASFRVLVSYGGKRLVCFGSLYRDSPLGDIRDQVMNEAKAICETLQM